MQYKADSHREETWDLQDGTIIIVGVEFSCCVVVLFLPCLTDKAFSRYHDTSLLLREV